MPRTPQPKQSSGRKTHTQRPKGLDPKELNERIAKARSDLDQGIVKNALQAARKYDIPTSTFYARLHGARSRAEAAEERQKLSPAQEAVVVEWGKFLGYMGLACTREDITAKAREVAEEGVDLGRHWWRDFKVRHKKTLKFKKAQALDPTRARNFSKEKVAEHFKVYLEAKQAGDVPKENTWNMDEKAIQMGGGRRGSNRHFFFDIQQKYMYKLKSDDLKMMTVIECVSASGVAMKPMFISPSDDVGHFWDVEGVGG